MLDLKTAYLDSLAACTPASLIEKVELHGLPDVVVAIGKSAGTMYDALASRMNIRRGFVAVPAGYPAPSSTTQVAVGGHPRLTDASFDAGRQLREFLAAERECTFLISGGGSACAEWPLEPWITRHELTEVNRLLVDAGYPIGDINTVRRHLSALKGGRLAAHLSRSVTLILSDVAAGRLHDVASGPTLPDPSTKADAIAILERLGSCDAIVTAMRDESFPETVKQLDGAAWRLLADNRTLVSAAASSAAARGRDVSIIDESMDGDVQEVAERLLEAMRMLPPHTILMAGGEPTVARRGAGRGGRCSELAVRFALLASASDLRCEALFGSSDGVDGSSGAAGVFIRTPGPIDPARAADALAASDSMRIIGSIGEPIMIPPTGNNLRDLFLLARS